MRHNAKLLRAKDLAAHRRQSSLYCFAQRSPSHRVLPSMVKIAFNSALAQKALGKEVPAAEKVGCSRYRALFIVRRQACTGRLQPAGNRHAIHAYASARIVLYCAAMPFMISATLASKRAEGLLFAPGGSGTAHLPDSCSAPEAIGIREPELKRGILILNVDRCMCVDLCACVCA